MNNHNRPLLANTNKIVDLGNEIEREDINGKYTFLIFLNFSKTIYEAAF